MQFKCYRSVFKNWCKNVEFNYLHASLLLRVNIKCVWSDPPESLKKGRVRPQGEDDRVDKHLYRNKKARNSSTLHLCSLRRWYL